MGQERPHFADLTGAADSVTQLVQQRIFSARIAHNPVSDAFRCSRLPGTDVSVEDHQRVLIGNQITYWEHAFMVLLAPLGQLPLVQKQLELVLYALVAARKPEQDFFAII